MPEKRSRIRKERSSQVMVDREALARLAYEFYLRRGGEHGHDVEDWLLAERFLLEESRPPRSRRSPTKLSRRLEDKFRVL